ESGELIKLALPSTGESTSSIARPLMLVEVWNEESESREKDILVGTAQVQIDEWLREKAGWVDLSLRNKPRGRVQIQVSLGGAESDAEVSSHDENEEMKMTAKQKANYLSTGIEMEEDKNNFN
ncbi:unnamed protein product, partial [Discosporangium mesarthrocarpum]